MKLIRVNQCSKCPWKVTTDPFKIPDGYCPTKHANLSETIAKPGEINCVGYLHNQLGIGNNIGLRFKFLNCENLKDLKIVGEQHQNFKDTLPK